MLSLRPLAFCVAFGACGVVFGGEMAADQRLEEAASLEDVAAVFIPEDTWQRQKATALEEQLREALTDNGGSDSVFLADADMGPLGKALLAVLNEEPAIPHVRYRLRYAQANVASELSSPLIVELVEISRFNLGPSRRAELIEIYGEKQVAPAAEFGQAPDVAWRLVTRPIMGQVAGLVHVARRELSQKHAADCLEFSCRDVNSLNEAVRDWPEFEPIEPLFDQGPLELSVLQVGLEKLGLHDEPGHTGWRIPEWPESVAAGEPFIDVYIERGLGQDDALDLVIHHDQLMDDHTRALWERLIVLGPGDSALMFSTSDQQPWPRQDQ
ncbi:hypothetical protein [Halomonas sp. GT]|uniref:hypothetical protein n=1 Tax=Halomonas sp. GT TaxID=1971364 RepID=UPI0009F25512|nr:hypothetical protein [Halomonas sp. GT]